MAGDALFVAIDVGTTGARACAVDLDGQLRGESRRPFATSTPRPGWAEQDPRGWRDAALAALADLAVAPGVAGNEVRAVGLTGQCPTIAPFDAARKPVGPGLLYRDNRATAEAVAMRRRIGDEAMHARTGHVASAFHVGPKVLWLRAHQPETFAATDCFMQPRDVVLHALTGATATDETHANSTVLFDLRQRDWSEDLLETFGLDAGLFPEVAAPWAQIGPVADHVARTTGLAAGCPVVIGAADSQCAAYGSSVMGPGPISEMAGASSCLNSVIPEPSSDLRITHYSYLIPGCYCTELGVNVTGGALTWAIDRLRMASFDELEAGARRTLSALAAGRIDSRSAAPLFMPYLGDGERDDPALRAAFIGLSDRHGRDELAYAVLEGIAFGVTETVSVLTSAGSPLDELRVGGGGARLATLGQLKADALERPVRHLEHDSAPVGVALLAAGMTGWRAEAEAALAANLERARCFEPGAGSGEPIRERYRWFLSVRDSPALRLQT
ncbi:MAG TPA: FGGY family carbohydrate kinase [Solirubrobacteraceae bacterium]|nr:FGGY family carbohydrate kinase [Solirubrobacteraceae bacterium]